MTHPDRTSDIARAHALLAELPARDYKDRTEDPDDPSTVQAMQMAINLPKADPPARNAVLVDAARAVLAVCLDPRASQDGFWRDGLAGWYSHRIRKVARRARNKAWDDVQTLPGATVGAVRAFVPSPVSDVPHEIAKLQIKGTEIEAGEELTLVDAHPTILINASLGMSAGKAAAQVGHASMLYAAALPLDAVQAWAREGFALNVREVPADAFNALVDAPGAAAVRDAGFTEVAPGSITALTLPPECNAELYRLTKR
ncbi:peptidyl-tRNA hydrolase [Corynebacterium sp. Q4381]|uniref:peptidyl-tRNA hydrolase n=1 Tax=Corynebacterium sp. Marseille-Q4381 TaxID=3121597 RepID=UPI002FE53EA5